MPLCAMSTERLCRNHLLGEYREVHVTWSEAVYGKQGSARWGALVDTPRQQGRILGSKPRQSDV
jgi:hypothetical protein